MTHYQTIADVGSDPHGRIPEPAPRSSASRYELNHLIARGGMAEVYRAHDLLLDRPVALKVLFPELSVDRSFVERFRREAQAAANLSHPNIVPVFDWGEDSRHLLHRHGVRRRSAPLVDPQDRRAAVARPDGRYRAPMWPLHWVTPTSTA